MIRKNPKLAEHLSHLRRILSFPMPSEPKKITNAIKFQPVSNIFFFFFQSRRLLRKKKKICKKKKKILRLKMASDFFLNFFIHTHTAILQKVEKILEEKVQKNYLLFN